jgi:hypothetical protein
MATYQKVGGIVGRELAGETILVPVRGDLASLDKTFVMNPVAAHVWHRLDGRTSLDAILDDILERFDVGVARARADLLELIAQFRRSALIREAEGEPLRGA